jgi:hypothetical protein
MEYALSEMNVSIYKLNPVYVVINENLCVYVCIYLYEYMQICIYFRESSVL